METNNETKIVIYKTPNGETQLDVTVHGDTIWLTQRQIAELFGTKVPAISKHLKNIFESGELERGATISKMGTVVNRGFRGSIVEVVISDASKKSTIARSTKDFLAESMCVAIKHLRKNTVCQDACFHMRGVDAP